MQQILAHQILSLKNFGKLALKPPSMIRRDELGVYGVRFINNLQGNVCVERVVTK